MWKPYVLLPLLAAGGAGRQRQSRLALISTLLGDNRADKIKEEEQTRTASGASILRGANMAMLKPPFMVIRLLTVDHGGSGHWRCRRVDIAASRRQRPRWRRLTNARSMEEAPAVLRSTASASASLIDDIRRQSARRSALWDVRCGQRQAVSRIAAAVSAVLLSRSRCIASHATHTSRKSRRIIAHSVRVDAALVPPISPALTRAPLADRQ